LKVVCLDELALKVLFFSGQSFILSSFRVLIGIFRESLCIKEKLKKNKNQNTNSHATYPIFEKMRFATPRPSAINMREILTLHF
jgi:hypothetical protein